MKKMSLLKINKTHLSLLNQFQQVELLDKDFQMMCPKYQVLRNSKNQTKTQKTIQSKKAL